MGQILLNFSQFWQIFPKFFPILTNFANFRTKYRVRIGFPVQITAHLPISREFLANFWQILTNFWQILKIFVKFCQIFREFSPLEISDKFWQILDKFWQILTKFGILSYFLPKNQCVRIGFPVFKKYKFYLIFVRKKVEKHEKKHGKPILTHDFHKFFANFGNFRQIFPEI